MLKRNAHGNFTGIRNAMSSLILRLLAGVSLLPFTEACMRSGTSHPNWAQVSSDSQLLRQAMTAVGGGEVGCPFIDSVTTVHQVYFENVRFVDAACRGVHAHTTIARVAVDLDGVVYLLDRSSSLNLLIARHPPRGVLTSTVVDYSLFGLTHSGLVSAHFVPIRYATEIPFGSDTTHVTLVVTRLEESLDNYWIVNVTGYEPETITAGGAQLVSFNVIVDKERGTFLIGEASQG